MSTQAKQIFLTLIRDIPEGQREEHLESACGGDEELRERVRTLLRAHEQGGSFLERPAGVLAQAVASIDATEAPAAGSPSVAETLQSGILGDYRILREIGRGGMGVVYEAEQISLGRTVALKVLPHAAMLDKTRLARFKNEARAAASLDHPNIVHVHAVGTERGVHYYAMQFIDGQTVADLITAEQPPARAVTDGPASDATGKSDLPEHTEAYGTSSPASSARSQALRDTPAAAHPWASTYRNGNERQRIGALVELAIQAAEALEHAHQMGVVHRDIKPSNLLVDAEQHLWVTDFGLAMVEAEGNLTASGSMLGTLRYMSPEQMRGDRHVLDHHTDIYSLGATLYEMLTLQPAFPDGDMTQLMRRVPHEEPIAPCKLNPSIPRDLQTIVLKAMSKDHDDRYATAGDMAADLQRFLDDEPIQAKPPGPAERIKKWSRRNRAAFATAAATLLVAIIVAAGLLWRERSRTLAAFAAEKQQRRTAERKEAEARRQTDRASRAESLAKRQAQLADQQRQLAIAQKEEAIRNVYIAQMRLVMDDWAAGQVRRLKTMLGRYLPQAGELDLRGWEWYYALSLAHGELMTIRGDGRGLKFVAWSADGRYLASASDGGVVTIRAADTGQELFTLEGHSAKVNVLAFSPNSRCLASTSADKTIRIWDLKDGRITITLNADAATAQTFIPIAWSPDGSRLAASTADGIVKIRDTTNWQVLFELHGDAGRAQSLCWSPDGSRVASGGKDGEVKIWDVATGEAIHVLSPPIQGPIEGPLAGSVASVAWSPDGEYLVSSSCWPCVCIWDVASGALTEKLGPGIAWRNGVAWSPNGGRLALAGDDGVVRIWEPGKGQQLRRLCGHTGVVWSVAWSPDGERLASCSQDTTIKIWDPELDAEAHSVPRGSGSQRFLAWSPDGKRLAVPGGDNSSLWVLDAATGQEVLTVHDREEVISSMAWSPDGQQLATGNGDGAIDIWDVHQATEVRTLRGHTGSVRSVAWSPNGHYLASGSVDTTARIWHLAAGKELLTLQGPDAEVDAVAWSPDGCRLACAPRESGVTIWDAGTGKQQLSLVPRGRSYVFYGSVSWSADGRQIASTGHSGWIEVWDALTGQQLACMRGHRGSKVKVAWHPGSNRLAGGGWSDRTVRIWDATSQQELLHFPGVSPVAWSPDGTQLAHFGLDGTVKIRDASIGYRIADMPDYRLGLARLLLTEQFHEEAIRSLEAFAADLARSPESPEWLEEAYALLGQAYFARGRTAFTERRFDEALSDFEQAIRDDPEHSEAYNLRGFVYLEQRDLERACNDFEKAVRLDPNDPDGCNNAAWALVTLSGPALRDPARAVAIAARAVELEPNVGAYWNTLGVAQYRAGDFSAAVTSLNKSIELDADGSSFPYNAYFLAMAHRALGNEDEAHAWYDRAEKRMTDDDELLRFQAEARALLGPVTDALPSMKKENQLGDRQENAASPDDKNSD